MDEKHKQNISSGMIKYWDDKRQPRLQKNGYLTLTVGNKKKYLHRLIMEEYLGRKLEKYEQVHHINEDKLDNRIENLELVCISEHQRKHAIDRNFGKSQIGKEPINKTDIHIRKQIKDLRLKGYLLKEICEITNISYPTVQKYAREVK